MSRHFRLGLLRIHRVPAGLLAVDDAVVNSVLYEWRAVRHPEKPLRIGFVFRE
jgi:hypothetical protein